jgi:hypothetical protein
MWSKKARGFDSPGKTGSIAEDSALLWDSRSEISSELRGHDLFKFRSIPSPQQQINDVFSLSEWVELADARLAFKMFKTAKLDVESVIDELISQLPRDCSGLPMLIYFALGQPGLDNESSVPEKKSLSDSELDTNSFSKALQNMEILVSRDIVSKLAVLFSRATNFHIQRQCVSLLCVIVCLYRSIDKETLENRREILRKTITLPCGNLPFIKVMFQKLNKAVAQKLIFPYKKWMILLHELLDFFNMEKNAFSFLESLSPTILKDKKRFTRPKSHSRAVVNHLKSLNEKGYPMEVLYQRGDKLQVNGAEVIHFSEYPRSLTSAVDTLVRAQTLHTSDQALHAPYPVNLDVEWLFSSLANDLAGFADSSIKLIASMTPETYENGSMMDLKQEFIIRTLWKSQGLQDHASGMTQDGTEGSFEKSRHREILSSRLLHCILYLMKLFKRNSKLCLIIELNG